MKRREFEEFQNTELGKRIGQIFNQLLSASTDCVIVFLSRKGYWLYRVFREFAGWNPEIFENVIIVSDRYIAKWKNEEWNHKKILIVDDTVTSGMTIFHVYAQLRRQYPEAEVIPMAVFMMLNSEELRTRMESILSREEVEVYLEDFIESLKEGARIAASEVGWLSYEQIHLFQQILVPYVVDLPYMTGKEIAEQEYVESWPYCPVIFKNKFEKLINWKDDWEYIDNSYVWENYLTEDGTEDIIHCGYFRYLDPNIYYNWGKSLFQIVVKCRYDEVEVDKVAILLTPFAVMGSIYFEEARRICLQLYEGTPFGKWILEERMNEKEHFTLLFRSIVYFISYYAGKIFQQFLKGYIAIETRIDTSLLEENSAQVFIDTVSEMSLWEEDDFLQRMSNINNGSTLIESDSLEGDNLDNPEEIKTNDVKRAYTSLYQQLIDQKRRDSNAMLSIETLYQYLCRHTSSINPEDRIRMFLCVLLQMVDQSVMGNRLQVKNGIIYRGFRYGENSDISLPFFNEYIYYGVVEFYYFVKRKCQDTGKDIRDAYKENIHYLFSRFKSMMQRNGYLKILSDDYELEQNERYFSNLSDNCDFKTLIENKLFRLERKTRFSIIEQDFSICAEEAAERINDEIKRDFS